MSWIWRTILLSRTTTEWKEDMAALGSALKDEMTAIRSTITENTVTMGTNVTEALATIRGDVSEEMAAIRSNIQEIQTGIASLHSAIHSFKEPLGISDERMAEALLLMMKMVKFVQQQTFQTQLSTPTEIPGATAQGTQAVCTYCNKMIFDYDSLKLVDPPAYLVEMGNARDCYRDLWEGK
ncbi:hypothetical protein SASPL_138192 [Salvia splendens]|uniref:Uncharacterized protein n=1 Tax=Salvia splendens TaxID=180675 RepID=A0A8X8ZES3_SALSN|nr:hypothetical protein SASPL_138192 [Salvia splendens]